MDDKAELFWRMYQENCTQGRHHEVQRAALTTVLGSVAAAALAFMRPTQLPISRGYLPLAFLLIALGLFGAAVTRKQYERFALHMRRAAKYRNRLDDMYPGLDLRGLKRQADAEHALRFKRLSKVSLVWLWVGIHLFIAIVGASVAVLAIWKIQ
jgi:hypothetical protein